MIPKVSSISKSNAAISNLFVVNKKTNLSQLGLSKAEIAYISKKAKQNDKFVIINRFDKLFFVQFEDEFSNENMSNTLEKYRILGSKVCAALNSHKYKEVCINDHLLDEEKTLAIAEGIVLANYQFIKYFSNKKQKNSLENIFVYGDSISQNSIKQLNILNEAVYEARNLVNEPQNVIDAVSLSHEFKKLGENAGFKVEILSKKQIESLKMGGLLAVNMGSQTPPTFSIMEYKPKRAKNKKPLVLVGKGVVYDTGGLSLKPTPNSMDTMKCDMAGSAAVACALYAIAKAKLNYHVIALVPATDNRPGENAYTPGDVIKMFDGQTVEVLNTDAEGRMILADALSYAKKYEPELVLDFATLTGAAAAAIGQYGIVCMGTASEEQKFLLKESGNSVHERLVEFPFWEDYGKLIKSDIADMKNIGGPVGGAITAGKFLEKFIDYPWMHFDIAGPAFINSNDAYRLKMGTGVGVRLIFDYVKKMSK
jgi:leucyl aminopeptidase